MFVLSLHHSILEEDVFHVIRQVIGTVKPIHVSHVQVTPTIIIHKLNVFHAHNKPQFGMENNVLDAQLELI